ncbi:MAG: ribonuclease E/G [Ilumatobacter coccineus]|uniref:Ribonuclease E/G n=1 Tax=Ilumatobacter coccineus TaxID=467094 RepID=A0A2G6K986_9ACTN|nr:MAG: ribonuclease E/G [Ilumatobacter coccineus]
MNDKNSGAGSGADKTPRTASPQTTQGNKSGPPRRRRRRPANGGSGGRPRQGPAADASTPEEIPESMREGRISDPKVADKALVRRSSAPPFTPSVPPPGPARSNGDSNESSTSQQSTKKKSGGRQAKGNKSGQSGAKNAKKKSNNKKSADQKQGGTKSSKQGGGPRKKRRGRDGRRKRSAAEQEVIQQRSGRERKGRPVGRYFMGVQVRPGLAQVGVLEGRNLIEHYVSRPADDVSQIHGNIYLGRVRNVLPGMEAAFVDIATPKNAVLYRGDVQYDPEDIEEKGANPRIEDILKPRQMIMCQVTKNPIGAKGARLTQEVSLPGRYVVLIPNSTTYGISKRLSDVNRRRLREILNRVKPAEHGLIVRTAAEHATEADLTADIKILLSQWAEIEKKAAKANRPTLLYREPELAVRVIREEFNPDYRGVVIDDRRLFEEVKAYVHAFNPQLADRIEFYDAEAHNLSLFEKYHIHEQVHKALDRKVWLPSGGSLIIEHTEALTVIDVNTGKNVGSSSLEETVFHNNMEAADEIAKQLRLRDIGGIIVIDFIDMEISENRSKVIAAFREALSRDKTRTQVFDISDLGLVEMTRKRIGEGLLTEFSEVCPDCSGRGVRVDHSMLD